MGNTQAKEHRSQHLKNQDRKKRHYKIALIVAAIIGVLFLTTGKSVAITDYDKISQGGIVQVSYGQYVEDGYYHDFTSDELTELRGILSEAEMVEIIPFNDSSMIYYLAYFYDTNGDQLFGLYMSMDGKVYYNNTHLVRTDAVVEFLNRYVLYGLVGEDADWLDEGAVGEDADLLGDEDWLDMGDGLVETEAVVEETIEVETEAVENKQ